MMGLIRRVTAILMLPLLLAWVACAATVDQDEVLAHVKFWLFIMVFFGVAQLLMLIPYWVIYRGAVNRRIVDVSAQNRPVTGLALRFHNDLVKMGFRRLGETDTPMPGRRKSLTWLYINADGSIHAELVSIMGGAVQFNTIFADHAILETSFPYGENIMQPTYRSVRVISGLSAALQRHLEIGQAMISEHGQPIAITDMPSYLAWDVRYRQLYTKIGKLGASYHRALHSTLLGAYGIVWLLVMWLVIELQGELTWAGGIFMAMLTLPPLVWVLRK